MKELLRSNDPVRLSWLEALLTDQGIGCIVFDAHTAIFTGSTAAIRRRLMVADDDFAQARRVLAEAGELPAGAPS